MEIVLSVVGLPSITFFKMYQFGDKKRYKNLGIIYAVVGCILLFWFLVYFFGFNVFANSYNPYSYMFKGMYGKSISYMIRYAIRYDYPEYLVAYEYIFFVFVYWISGIILTVYNKAEYQLRKKRLEERGYSFESRLAQRLRTEYMVGDRIELSNIKANNFYYALLAINMILFVVNMVSVLSQKGIIGFSAEVLFMVITLLFLGNRTKTDKWKRVGFLGILFFIIHSVVLTSWGHGLMRSFNYQLYYEFSDNIAIFATIVFYLSIIISIIFISYFALIQKECTIRERIANWIKANKKTAREILSEKVTEEVDEYVEQTKDNLTEEMIPQLMQRNEEDDEATVLGSEIEVQPLTVPRKGDYILPSGTLLNNRYKIKEVIGEGGFGITYKVIDTKLSKQIAVKEYYPSGYASRHSQITTEVIFAKTEDAKYYEDGKSKFLLEAKILAKFSDEPGIVNVSDYFEENNTAYIVTEYLSGETLKSYVEQYGKLRLEEVKTIFRPILQSLKVIHKSGYIHRDISPSNIMINSKNQAKLLDFGAARDVEPQKKKTISILLKPGYAPMEQYLSRSEQGGFTDVYALGATIYKCLTGITPDDSLKRGVKDELKSISDMGIGINEQSERAVLKALSLKKEKRYQTIETFEKDFYKEN